VQLKEQEQTAAMKKNIQLIYIIIQKNKMKKIIGFLTLAVVFSIMACSDKPAQKEVIVVPATPVIIVKDPPEKSTTNTEDKNGVKEEAKKKDLTVKKK
jgi:hypothetical protein